MVLKFFHHGCDEFYLHFDNVTKIDCDFKEDGCLLIHIYRNGEYCSTREFDSYYDFFILEKGV